MSDDFSELGALEHDIASTPPETAEFLAKAIEVSARNLKDDWRGRARIAGYYPKTYGSAISYDMHTYEGFGGGEIYAEVGPKLHTTPGASAGFLEEAGNGVDGPPLHAGRDALEAVEPDFIAGIEKAVADGISKALGI